jgi:hypothetical protein
VIKLYKSIGGVLHYHEAWESDGSIIEHWGRVGERGEERTTPIEHGRSEDEAIEAALADARKKGYAEIDESEHTIVLVEYTIDGMGSPQDLEKRHALEDRLNEALGWTGLGHCDGGSTGSGSMEASCFVVDADIAQRVIAEDLKGTPFGDYAAIFAE